MNNFIKEVNESSSDNGSFDDPIQNSFKEVNNYLNQIDFSQASCSTKNPDNDPSGHTSSSNGCVKRKFSTAGMSKSCEESSSTSRCSNKPVRKFVKIDMENIDVTEVDNNESIDIDMKEPEFETPEEQEVQADEEEENRTNSSVISCSENNSDSEAPDLGEHSEDAVRDDKRSCCTSQASADEASLSSSESSISSQSSGSDIFVAEEGSHHELSEEDNNNNHSGNEIIFTGDSDDESESNSDDQYESGSAERIPQVLKKTLPNEKFSFPEEIMNRQFHDNFKRKRTIKFETKICGSRKLVQRLELYEMLKKHSGCVNSIFFNDTGEILISASDDRHACLWDWAHNKSLLYFDTGHVANVFQAKFLPCTGDTHMVTCGADSQVRMCLLDQCGLKSTSLIVKHAKTVHKIALQRQMPNTFLSAGEDGVVYSIDIRESNHFPHKLLKVVNARSKPHLPVFLYSIDCNPMKNQEFVVCGNDKDIRLYDQRKISPDDTVPVKTFCPISLSFDQDPFHRVKPQQLKKYMKSVTCAVFNYNGTEILASYNDNDIYLFDSCTTEEVHHYDGHRNFASIKGVNFYGPHSEYIVSGSDCGHIYLWDKNSEAIVQWMKGDEHIVNCLEPHPVFPVLATSGIDSDVKIWMPTGKGETEVKELREFQKVTRKNYFFKYTSASDDSRRWAILRSSFLATDIVRYHIAVDLALGINEQFNNIHSTRSSPEGQNDHRSSDSSD